MQKEQDTLLANFASHSPLISSHQKQENNKMATIYKRGKYYWVSYKDRNGRRIQESTKLGDKAAAVCIKKHYDAVEKSYCLVGTPLQQAIRFSDWFNEYIQLREHRRAKKTIANDKLAYNSLLKYLNGDKYLNEIKENDIDQWYNELLKEKAIATANCFLRHINTLFNQAVKKKYIHQSPCHNIDKARETINKVRALSEAEVQILLACMPPVWQNLVKVALYTGARAGEICQFKKKDVDLVQQTITVSSSSTNPTKSKKFRVVPFPRASMDFFRQIMKLHRKEYLLLNNKDAPWLVDWISHGFTKFSQKSGVKCTFHDLRRTYGAWLIMNGADLVTVQENLGHSDITVTRNHYIHLIMDHKKKQVDKLPVI